MDDKGRREAFPGRNLGCMKRKKKWLIAGGVAVLLVLVIGIMSIMSTIEAALAIIGGNQEQSTDISLDGLPGSITVEMVEALLEMQDTYGQPVSAGLAQIIKESTGSYGPGLSQLGYEQKNLFGIKYFSSDPNVTGAYNYSTGEQTSSGAGFTIVAGFAVYPSYTACIKTRAWMLERSPYIDKVSRYKKTGNSYSKEQANGFISGIREAGWATDVSYVTSCISLMQTYDLYRFDNMTLDKFKQGGSNLNGGGLTGSGQEYKSSSAAQKRIVDTAYATGFAGDGLCATWVSRVFANAGQSYPYGNANSFSMSRESGGIKVGMAIAVTHSGADYNSWNYGHIGIYIGDGKVMHNESSRTGNVSNGCTITDLDVWKATYEYQCSAYYGWVNGIDLSR